MAGGSLTLGVSVNASITYRGQNEQYTFSGTNGQHVTLDVTSASFNGTAYLQLIGPGGTQLGYLATSSGATSSGFTLNATGTWTVQVDGYGATTGSATFRLLP